MKAFISSLIRGLEPERDAAASGIRSLGHEPRRAEDFGASPDSPQIVCRAGVRQSDLTILILGAGYGAVQPSGVSATEEEYQEAKQLQRPVLAFVQSGVEPEPRQAAFMDDVRRWMGGQFTGSFDTPAKLAELVVRGLHDFEVMRAAGPVDVAEMRSRAEAAVPALGPFRTPTPRLVVAIAGGPRRSVLRPEELEAEELAKWLQREALFGSAAVFDASDGTQVDRTGATLALVQPDAALRIDEEGTLSIEQPVWDPTSRMGMSAVIHEEVTVRLERAIQLGAAVLDHVDPLHRLSDVVPVAAIIGAAYGAWRSRAEHERSPNQMAINMRGVERVIVALPTPRLHRGALPDQAGQTARDLAVLLRRAMTEGA
ncbi:MAG TPA: DUF4062 domain-containing protein [Thermoleophilaceae bacterium]|nr:DUF4062 domain-containing protein [Thermoleophilaceae bacterium]